MEHVAAANVSDEFLPLLGARPALGRTLDSRIDASKQQVFAILISDALRRRRFSADPGLIGKSVSINELDMQIAGVPAWHATRIDPQTSLRSSRNADRTLDVGEPEVGPKRRSGK